MKSVISGILAVTLWLAGCHSAADEEAATGSSAESAAAATGGSDAEASGSETPATDGGASETPEWALAADEEAAASGAEGAETGSSREAAAGTDGEIALTPENTDIVFIGTHAPPADPDPRTCEFTDFAGTAMMSGGALTAVEVTIKTEGITTFSERLTDHLRNPDFFHVLEYPEATFKSTKIEAGADGSVTITGDLTLLAETKPVTFPATVSTADGLTLTAEFTIDRTEWGMTARQDGVSKDVTLQLKIGG